MEKRNVVLILTDDQGYGNLRCHGNPYLKTDNLDKLCGESMSFTNFHVSPTCAPTRSALMSGRHEFKNGVTHTLAERERLSLKTFTLPSMSEWINLQGTLVREKRVRPSRGGQRAFVRLQLRENHRQASDSRGVGGDRDLVDEPAAGQ